MSNSDNSIMTTRFVISPIFPVEIKNRLEDSFFPEELKAVLRIPGESCDNRVCYKICHKGFEDPIGIFRADKFPGTGTVKFYFAVLDEGSDSYLAEESVDAILRSFYHDKDFFFYEITVDANDESKKHIMETLFFKKADNQPEESNGALLYTREKPPVMWGVIYLMLGIVAGLLFGICFRQILLGLAAGVVLALAFGLITDLLARKKRIAARKQKDRGR